MRLLGVKGIMKNYENLNTRHGTRSLEEQDEVVRLKWRVLECVCQTSSAFVFSPYVNANNQIISISYLKRFSKPSVLFIILETENVIQPLIPKPLHTAPPNEDYVSPATKSILDDLLEEFRDEILKVTMVKERAKCNPAKDIEELERLLAKEPQSNFTDIQFLIPLLMMMDDSRGKQTWSMASSMMSLHHRPEPIPEKFSYS
ncbi:hypothetical protein Tco_0304866 [Tanacetum coccineum]